MHNDSYPDNSFPALFYADWQLLLGTNFNCEYDSEPASVLQEHFSYSQIMVTAYKILSFNYPHYLFSLYGGEPEIHPYFPDLVRYLLTSGRDARLKIRTNGLRTPAWHAALFRGMPEGRAFVEINAHPLFMNLTNISAVMDAIYSNGQECGIKINILPDTGSEIKTVRNNLSLLLRRFHCSVSFAFPCGMPKNINDASLLEHYGSSGEKSVIRELGFYCAGTSACHITPQGELTLGLAEADEPYGLAIMEDPSFLPDLPNPPVFPSYEEAEAWLKAFRAEQIRRVMDTGPARPPEGISSPAPSPIWRRLRRLTPCRGQGPAISPNPMLWEANKEKIASIYQVLANDEDKEVFLRALRASLLGDGSYLPEECQREMPETNKPLNIQKFLAEQLWRPAPFCIGLNINDRWLEQLDILIGHVKNTEFHLCCINDSLALRGIPTSDSAGTVPEPAAVPGMLTVAVAGWEDDYLLAKRIESLLEQPGLCLDMVFILDAGAPMAIQLLADEICRMRPDCARSFRFPQSLGTESFWEALPYARGEYFCVLMPGNGLTASGIADIMSILENDSGIGAALPVEGIETEEVVNATAAMSAFLRGDIQPSGICNAVCKTELAKDLKRFLRRLDFELPECLGAMLLFTGRFFLLPGIGEKNPISRTEEDAAPVREFFDLLKYSSILSAATNNADAVRDIDLWEARNFASMWRLLDLMPRDERMAVIWAGICNENLEMLQYRLKLVYGLIDELVPAPFRIKRDPIACPLCIPVAKRGEPFVFHFALSVIVVVEGAQDMRWQEAALRENCGLVQWIVVDNGSDGDTAEELEEKLDMFPNMLLFRLAESVSIEECYNAGLDKACGDAVLFTRGSSRLASGIGELAKTLLSRQDQDAFILGMMHETEPEEWPPVDCGGTESFMWFLRLGLTFAPDRFLLRKNRAIEKGLRFIPDAAVPGIDYIVEVFSKFSCSFRLHNRFVGIRGNFRSETVIAKDALPGAGTIWQKLDDVLKISDGGSQTGLWDFAVRQLETVWLPAFHAWKRTHGETTPPLPACGSFITALLLARAKNGGSDCWLDMVNDAEDENAC